MLRPRIIPCLLIHNKGLVKTTYFKNPKYVGDPINAVKIFNEKNADELMVLDIDASRNNLEPNYEMIKKLAAECQMPLCYGGGIKNRDQAMKIIDLGVEKISLSSILYKNLSLISEIASSIGSQSVVATIDLLRKNSIFKTTYQCRTRNMLDLEDVDAFNFIKLCEDEGVGEIVINSIDRDGEMKGYDINLADKINNMINIPLTILGGAGSHEDMKELIAKCGIIGSAAGSLFVFKGKYRAVLINYPSNEKKQVICSL